MNQRDRFVAAAQGELGKPYSAHRDCSGLVAWAARQAGFLLPEGSVAQYTVGHGVPVRDLIAGDLVFWNTFGPSPGHVAIAINPSQVIHAINPEQGIIISNIHANMGGPMVGVRRLTFADEDTPNPKDPINTGGTMSDVTPQSPFRELGNTTREAFRVALSRTITGTPSPMAPEADAIYDALAAHGLTRLGAAMCWIERSNDTNPADLAYYGRNLHNAWAVKLVPSGEWARYERYADGAKQWTERILGPTYADLTTLAEFVARYAPWSDGNNPDDYGRKVAAQVNAMPQEVVIEPIPDPEPDPSDGPLDPWRPYPFPPMVKLICAKPYDGAGFDRVKPRGPRIIGSCNHITDGWGSIEYYSQFFSTGGERALDALVDTVIGRDGRIGLLNDWRDPQWGGTRAGWANGTANGLEGDGVDFYRRQPLINDVLVSKEHEGKTGEPLTAAQFAASVELSTAVAQSAKCPWDRYPYHPGFGGINIEMMHFLFAPKACPAEPFISTWYPQLIAAVKAKLKDWQGGQPGEPLPPENPVWYTRFGFSLHDIQEFFGTISRENRDGTVDQFGFDPQGALSLLWLNRCDKEGKFPEAERIWYSDAQFVDGQEMWASWEGGWMAYLPLLDSRASWTWLDQELPT